MSITACHYGSHDFVHDPKSVWRVDGLHVHVCAACGATYCDSGEGPCYACREAS